MIDFQLKKRLNGPNGNLLLDVKAQLEQGDLLAIYGASGAGKTSLLRLLAGLLPADEGEITVDGEVWLRLQVPRSRLMGSSKVLSVQQRSVGMLFQDYALFPHFTVEENLTFALPKKQSNALVDELVEVMQLGDLRHQKPALLSGGQRQRVALARALVRQPKLLLLDEPLAAVDGKLRLHLQAFIQQAHQEYGLTTILVSHDKAEIIRLANRVVVLDEGAIVQSGSPEEVFGVREQLTGTVVRSEDTRLLVLVGDQLTWIPRRGNVQVGEPILLD